MMISRPDWDLSHRASYKSASSEVVYLRGFFDRGSYTMAHITMVISTSSQDGKADDFVLSCLCCDLMVLSMTKALR